MKKIFYTELAYIIGLVALATGAAFMEAANFGLSMVVAPAYLLHLKVSQYLPFFSFGMAEYTFQAMVLILLILILRKFKISYLFSFVTAVLYGYILDGAMFLVALLPCEHIGLKLLYYVVGLVLCSIGVSLLFHTYISPEVYELFVKEISKKYKLDIHKCKTVYDCCSCLLGVLLSFAFFGLWHFEGVKLGTLVCTLINGWLIGRITKVLERHFVFKDRFDLKERFFS